LALDLFIYPKHCIGLRKKLQESLIFDGENWDFPMVSSVDVLNQSKDPKLSRYLIHEIGFFDPLKDGFWF